jgi:hypothetical protein
VKYGLIGPCGARRVNAGDRRGSEVEIVVEITEWPFLGRGEELAALVQMVSDPQARGVVLAGPPGVGKTRLAAECAAAPGTDS